MKLESFSVKNYRSISSTDAINLSSLSVIVGRNNEGKSNFLYALRTALELLALEANNQMRRPASIYTRSGIYLWERDYPVGLQQKLRPGESTFRLDFSLNSKETKEFRRVIGSRLNGILPIQISIGPQQSPKFKVLKQGKAGESLSSKSSEIARFIGSRLQFTYIEAVRTDKHSKDAVNSIIERELQLLERDPQYQAALDKITQLQLPVLHRASQRITSELSNFIPDVKSVSLDLSKIRRSRALREAYEIEIDDGTKTPLDQKGDGIKSLAAISLLKGAPIDGGLSFLAVEEPESHLHPGAMHKLKSALIELSSQYQIVISTHNPIFVNRSQPESNILVQGGRVGVAKRISDVRLSLGVKPGDSLVGAALVILVEGLSDCRIIQSILVAKSVDFSRALERGDVLIKHVGGVEKIPAQVIAFTNAVTDLMCVVDGDLPGRNVAQDLISRGLVNHSDVTILNSPGMDNCEIEDMVKSQSYISEIKSKFGVDLNNKKFSSKYAKWSERVKDSFDSQGIFYDEATLSQVKTTVADMVCADPLNSIHPSLGAALDALVSRVIERVKALV